MSHPVRDRLSAVLAEQTRITDQVAMIRASASSDDNATRAESLLEQWDDLEAERVPLAEKVERLDKIREVARNPANRQGGTGNPGDWSEGEHAARTYGTPYASFRQDPFVDLERQIRHTAPDDPDVIARAVTAIEQTRQSGVTDEQREAATRIVETVPGAAHHALVHGSPAYLSAFQEWGRTGGQMPTFNPAEVEAVRASLSLTGANGGFTLPTFLDPTLVKTGTVVNSPIRSIAQVQTITQNVWHGVTVGNVTAYWVAEAAEWTEGNPAFDSPAITASKLTAYLPGSYEIFEDSTLLSQLPGIAAEALELKENEAFINGSGSGAPRGIVTAISATVGSTVTATTRGSFTSASAVDLYNLVEAIPARYEDNATFVANKRYFNIINQMSPQGGGSLFWGDLRDKVARPLLGSPIVKSSAMLSTTTSGTVGIVYGDFSRFLVVDRLGTQVEFVQNVFSTTGLPQGKRALLLHKRVGSDVLDLGAFRFLKM